MRVGPEQVVSISPEAVHGEHCISTLFSLILIWNHLIENPICHIHWSVNIIKLLSKPEWLLVAGWMQYFMSNSYCHHFPDGVFWLTPFSLVYRVSESGQSLLRHSFPSPYSPAIWNWDLWAAWTECQDGGCSTPRMVLWEWCGGWRNSKWNHPVVTVWPRYPTCSCKQHKVFVVNGVMLVGLTAYLWVEGIDEYMIVTLLWEHVVPHWLRNAIQRWTVTKSNRPHSLNMIAITIWSNPGEWMFFLWLMWITSVPR